MVVKHKKTYTYFPINALLIFNIITIILFIFGPIKWQLDNQWVVVSYILSNLLALYFGYSIGLKSYKHNVVAKSFEENKNTYYFILIFGLLWFFPTLYLRLGGANFSLNGFLDRISDDFLNSAIGYKEKIDNYESGTLSILIIPDLFFRPFFYALFPLSLLYFKRFSKLFQFIFVLAYMIECLSWISIGTNKGIVDIFLTFFFIGIVVDPNLYKFSAKKIFITLLSVGSVLSFFINTMMSRFGLLNNSDLLEKIDLNILGNPLKTNGIYAEMAIGVKFAFMHITSYLSQGYYSLALALKEPSTWSYGFGNSIVGLNTWKKLTGEDLIPKTYMGLVYKSHGIDPDYAWSSIYTWLASDFTFFGVPFVLLLIGYYFAYAWMDTIHRITIYAPIVFCLFSQMIFYFFANNQIFSFSFVPFITFFILWRFSRRKIVYI